MDNTITPRELQDELEVDAKRIRAWLRAQGWQQVAYTRWRLTPQQAHAVRREFRQSSTPSPHVPSNGLAAVLSAPNDDVLVARPMVRSRR